MSVFYSHMSEADKKALRSPHSITFKAGMQPFLMEDILDRRTKSYMLQMFNDPNHFIHEFLPKLPSGRLQTYKHR